MRRIRVVVVGPKYQMNLGYIARVMKNFGVTDLAIVAPRCRHTGKQAIKYSKHAHELLEHAKVYGELKDAARGMVVGTTGIWEKSDHTFHNVYGLSEMRSAKGWQRSRDLTIVLGRDDTGLSKDELEQCDAVVFIGSNRSYPVFNISHALAIMLYEFTLPEFAKEYSFTQSRADGARKKRLYKLFDMMVQKRGNIRDKRAVSGAFRRVVNRSMPTNKEINAMAAAISPKDKSRK